MSGIIDNSQMNIFESETGTALAVYKTRLEKLKNGLIDFGLSPNQSKVFIYLGKYGATTASIVSKSLHLPRTETYQILNGLQRRGIVSAEFSSPTKYSAVTIEKTISTILKTEKEKLDVLIKREKELADLWNSIPAFVIETDDVKAEKMQMIPGSIHVHSKMKEMIESSKEEILLLGTEKDLSRFYHADIIDMLANSMLDVKIIVSPAHKMPNFINGINKKRVKLIANNKSEKQCFLIKDHEEVLLFLRNASHPSADVFALWADSKSVIDSMYTLFDYSWGMAGQSK